MSILEISVWFVLDFGAANRCRVASFLQQRWPDVSAKGGRMDTTDGIHLCIKSLWEGGNKHGEWLVLGMAMRDRSCTEGRCFPALSVNVQTSKTPQLQWDRGLGSSGNSPALRAVAWTIKCFFFFLSSFMSLVNGDGWWAAGQGAEQSPWVSVPWREPALLCSSSTHLQELSFLLLVAEFCFPLLSPEVRRGRFLLWERC